MTAVVDPQLPDAPDPAVPEDSERPPARTRHRRQTSWPRTAGVLALAVVVLLVVPVLVWLAADTIANSTEGRSVATTTIPEGVARAALPDTPGGLLVLQDAQGVVAGFAVLAVDPSGAGGTIVSIPAGTRADVSGVPGRLAEASAAGFDAQVRAVEGFLGVAFGTTAAASPADLEGLLSLYAPFDVELPDDIVAVQDDGAVVVVVPRGPARLTAAQAAAALTEVVPNESEITRLPVVAAVWGAVAARGGVANPGVQAGVDRVDGLLAAVLAGSATSRPLPAEPILDRVNNPDGDDLLLVDVAQARLAMAQVLPSAVSPSQELRVRLISPPDRADLAVAAVGRLVFVGATVVVASESDAPIPATTLVEYQAPGALEAARALGDVLGSVDVRTSSVLVDGVDVTITLGRSFDAVVAAADTTTVAPGTPTTEGE